jgi:uncharacterized protein YcsI (UPF0317 family)
MVFAQRNPKPCPLIEVGEIGDPTVRFCAHGADVRTDIPKYHLYRNGEFEQELLDIKGLWRDEFVYFLLGCSFTFERALRESGLEIRHITEGGTVPMFKTTIPCAGAGKFRESPMVVSMRPFKPEEITKVVEITREYPAVHGAPIHVGNYREIGIENLHIPDFGDPVTVKSDEIPVFWACGVTPQIAAIVTRPPIMITHAPGHMFVGDKRESEFKLG